MGVIGATMAAEPVIVTPRSAKRPDRQFLRDIKEQEEIAILKADEVYVLGWSTRGPTPIRNARSSPWSESELSHFSA